MASLLHRWFGLGSLPRAMVPILEQEGIVLLDEGCWGTVTFRNFRAPGKRYGLRKNGVLCSIVLTRLRLAAFQFNTPMINLGLSLPIMKELHCTLESTGTLCMQYDAATFNDSWSGSVTLRVHTDKASAFLKHIRESPGRL